MTKEIKYTIIGILLLNGIFVYDSVVTYYLYNYTFYLVVYRFPIELYSNEVISQKLDYIHQNPVIEGYVERAEDYLYSSAKDYTGEKGLINVNLIG